MKDIDNTAPQAESNIKSWVFLSHSNLDYDKVTFVRNILEKYSMRPIMFFLKCVEQDKELDGLLKREIDARDKFILCESENARESEWVQKEVEYIKSKERIYQTIYLDQSEDLIEQAILGFVNRSKVFISYSSRDTMLARLIAQKLRERGFSVWIDFDSISPGETITDVISKALDSSLREGYQLALLSEGLMNSSWTSKELQYFIHQGGEKWIIPVKIDPTPLSPEVVFMLGTVAIGDVSMYESDEEKAEKAVQFFVRRDMELSK